MTTHILIIAHAPLASALRACVGHVFADRMDTVVALDVQASDTIDAVLQQARQLRQGMDAKDVLVLTDVMGATPCNVARRGLPTRDLAHDGSKGRGGRPAKRDDGTMRS